MTARTLEPVPLTGARFAEFGDVIEASSKEHEPMNEARFTRFNDLAKLDIDLHGGHVAISIAKSRTPTVFPHRFDLVERHPLGSQAFIPLGGFAFVVVVAPRGESVEVADLRAFVTNGHQGINYHRGTWHMPLIASAEGHEFLIVDRAPGIGNLNEMHLDQPVILNAPA